MCSKICKLRTCSISADNVILFFFLNTFHGGCHGNVAWKSASNWYQFLPRPRLSGYHAMSRLPNIKCWIMKVVEYGTASVIRYNSICCRRNIRGVFQTVSSIMLQYCCDSMQKECLSCIRYN